MSRLSNGLIGLLPLLGAVGCGRFGFGLLDAQAGRADPVFDAGTVPRPADGGSYARAPDASRDATAPDGALPSLAPGPLDCEAVAGSTFCANFDDDEQPPGTRALEAGTGSVRFANGTFTAAIEDSSFDHATLNVRLPASDHWYLRFLLWIPSGVTVEELNIAAFGTGGEPDGVDTDFNLVRNSIFEVHFDETPLDFDFEVGAFPRDQWLCFETRVDFDDRNGSVRSSFLGDPDLTVYPVDNRPPMGIDELRLGIDWASSAQGAAGLRFDDVLISTTDYAGCP